MAESNGKIVKMITWVREDLAGLIKSNDESHRQLYKKLDRVESKIQEHNVRIDEIEQKLLEEKRQRLESTKLFFVKVGVMLSAISTFIGVILNVFLK